MTRDKLPIYRIKLITFLIILLGLPIHAIAADKDGTLVFGFLPILSTQKLVKRFEPLVNKIAEDLHRPVRMETAPNYVEFLKRTREKRYDILFTAPHFYYLAHVQSGYKVIVRVNAKKLNAIIVATKASHITSLSGLRGRTIATPAAISLGTALIRNTLRKAGLDPDKDVKIVTTPNHNAALLTAYNGITDAAGLMIPPYMRASEKVHNAMVVLGKTAGTAHMPIAVSATLAPEVRARIKQTLVSLKQTEKGRAILKHMSWPMGFTKATDSEYAPLKEIVKEMHLK